MFVAENNRDHPTPPRTARYHKATLWPRRRVCASHNTVAPHPLKPAALSSMEFAELIHTPKLDGVILYSPLNEPVDGTLCITGHHLILSSRREGAQELWVRTQTQARGGIFTKQLFSVCIQLMSFRIYCHRPPKPPTRAAPAPVHRSRRAETAARERHTARRHAGVALQRPAHHLIADRRRAGVRQCCAKR